MFMLVFRDLNDVPLMVIQDAKTAAFRQKDGIVFKTKESAEAFKDKNNLWYFDAEKVSNNIPLI